MVESELLFPSQDVHENGGWVYHSENWIRVVRRREDRKRLQQGRSLSLRDNKESPADGIMLGNRGELVADVPADSPDKWVYLYLRPEEHVWRDYSWKFRVRRQTQFRELQFGLRYQDFYNRYRFRHEDDFWYFDKVLNGRFINGIGVTPFKMLDGRDYEVEIRATGSWFSIAVDGKTCIEAYDSEESFPQGSIAIILWEDDGVTPIRASITHQSVTELTPSL